MEVVKGKEKQKTDERKRGERRGEACTGEKNAREIRGRLVSLCSAELEGLGDVWSLAQSRGLWPRSLYLPTANTEFHKLSPSACSLSIRTAFNLQPST